MKDLNLNLVSIAVSLAMTWEALFSFIYLYLSYRYGPMNFIILLSAYLVQWYHFQSCGTKEVYFAGEVARILIYKLRANTQFIYSIVESPRDVPYGDINLQECMYSLPTILP
jgi:hypothetical protein